MSEISDRYRNVAAQFTERVKEVPDGAWADPAPCEGWDARDVVRHLGQHGERTRHRLLTHATVTDADSDRVRVDGEAHGATLATAGVA